ncbi:MAG TPA: dihydrofolate reductase family protein [Gemmatimonadaceae bacterium]|nr:dihydrofolate reductase family protein [Gemmatimonadaceae bacterium]
MRRIVVTEFLTLDGVMESPEKWSFPFWNEEAATFKHDELLATDALLLGRVTYEGFAAAWPSRTDESGFADRINSLPKFVVSTTLRDVSWNNSRLIAGNVADEVARLKDAPGGDIGVHGSCTLAQTLIRQDLVDEYHLLVYPVVRGSGKRLFADGVQASLTLADSKTFATGVVALVYRPARQR